MKRYQVNVINEITDEYYGDPETFDTRQEAKEWIRKRTMLFREHDVRAEIIVLDKPANP